MSMTLSLAPLVSLIAAFSFEEHKESEAKCDEPRVAGGPGVLSKSAALSRAKTKCKAADPASSHLWKPWRAAKWRVVAYAGRTRAPQASIVANFLLPRATWTSRRVSQKMATLMVGRSIEAFARSDAADSRYFGRGIGTALCRASLRWAQDHDYRSVIAPGTPDNLFEFSVWAGGLPWTTYRRLGFSDTVLEVGDELPEWVKCNPPREVREAVKAALAAGRPKREFHSRLMVLKLRDV